MTRPCETVTIIMTEQEAAEAFSGFAETAFVSGMERSILQVEDAEIIALYWERDQKAVEATEQKYRHYCKKIALNIVGCDEDAEECVNDTWLGAWESIPPARPEVLGAFLGKITRNIALNRVRDRDRMKRGGGTEALPFDELGECIADSGSGPEETAEAGELTALLNRFLAGLPQKNIRVQILVRRQRFGHRGTVRSR